MPECQAAPPRTVRCRTDDAARHEYRDVSANDNQPSVTTRDAFGKAADTNALKVIVEV